MARSLQQTLNFSPKWFIASNHFTWSPCCFLGGRWPPPAPAALLPLRLRATLGQKDWAAATVPSRPATTKHSRPATSQFVCEPAESHSVFCSLLLLLQSKKKKHRKKTCENSRSKKKHWNKTRENKRGKNKTITEKTRENNVMSTTTTSAQNQQFGSGMSKVYILDKYFHELQKFWDTEKRLQGKFFFFVFFSSFSFFFRE